MYITWPPSEFPCVVRLLKQATFHLYSINRLVYVIGITSVFVEEESKFSCIRYFKFLFYNIVLCTRN